MTSSNNNSGDAAKTGGQSVDDRVILIPSEQSDETVERAGSNAGKVTGESGPGFGERAADAIEGATARIGEIGRRVEFNLTYWVALIALVVTCGMGWTSSAVISGSSFRAFRVTGETMLDPEPFKMAAHNSQMIQLIEAISLQQEEGELTMAFRQAEMSFYGDLPFVYYISDSLAEIYETRSPDELFEELHARNIRYFAVPSYSRAELENSQFEPLLGNPRYVELLYELNDYRLFALRDAPVELQAETLVREDFSSSPDDLANWSLSIRPLDWLSSLTHALTNDHASIRHDPDRGFVEISRERSYRARPEIVDILQRGELGPGVSAFVIDQSDFDASLGTMQLVAEVEGDGYAEVVMTAYDRNGTQLSMEPQVLWNGVLFDGNRRTIHAQFTDLSYRILPSALGDQDRLYRIFFQLRDGGYLRLYNWEVNHFPEVEPRSSAFTDAYLSPLNNGWGQVGDDLHQREFYFTTASVDPDPADDFLPVRIRRFDSRTIAVSSPTLSTPAEFYARDRLETSTRLSSTIRPAIEMTTNLAGTGVVDMTAVIQCSSILPDVVEEAAGEGAAWSRSDENTIRVPLGTVLLTGNSRTQQLSFDTPCLPQLAWIEYATSRNTLLVRRDNTLSDIEIRDLDMSLRLLDVTGEITNVPLSIATRQVNEFRRSSSSDG